VKANAIRTVLAERFGLDYPIFQAPLAGGGDTPELVAAVSESSALGFIVAGYLTPEQIAAAAAEVRAKTSRPFGINVFAPLLVAAAPNIEKTIERLSPYFRELGLPAPGAPSAPLYTFDDQLAACLETGASVFSFTFGLLPSRAIEQIKSRNMFLIGTATTVEEAIALAKSGVDAIVTQGSEAGGHRGTFREVSNREWWHNCAGSAGCRCREGSGDRFRRNHGRTRHRRRPRSGSQRRTTRYGIPVVQGIGNSRGLSRSNPHRP
jgi:NAD(P)H-dependent flavin oxidoreductase YrpB (nitropropane dioxygenase family)